METDFYIIVALSVAALGGGNEFHVVIIVLLGFGLSPERVAGVVSNGPRVVSLARRAGRCMRGTHVGFFVFRKSRWREERFKDAIEWATGALIA